MNIKKILCLLLSLLFIIGSISIINAADDEVDIVYLPGSSDDAIYYRHYDGTWPEKFSTPGHCYIKDGVTYIVYCLQRRSGSPNGLTSKKTPIEDLGMDGLTDYAVKGLKIILQNGYPLSSDTSTTQTIKLNGQTYSYSLSNNEARSATQIVIWSWLCLNRVDIAKQNMHHYLTFGLISDNTATEEECAAARNTLYNMTIDDLALRIRKDYFRIGWCTASQNHDKNIALSNYMATLLYKALRGDLFIPSISAPDITLTWNETTQQFEGTVIVVNNTNNDFTYTTPSGYNITKNGNTLKITAPRSKAGDKNIQVNLHSTDDRTVGRIYGFVPTNGDGQLTGGLYPAPPDVNGSFKINVKNFNGPLYVIKQSATPELLEKYPIDGAEFTVYMDEECTQIAKDINGSNAILTVPDGSTDGKTNIINIEFGTYYIKETKAPNGYKLNNEVKTVTIQNEDTQVSTTFINEIQKGKIFIKKMVDGTTTNEPIGCKFTVYTDENCTQVAKDINGNNAVLTIVRKEEGQDYWVSDSVELYVGTYYVKETYAPNPFVFDTELTQDFEIKDEKIISRTFTNSIQTGYIIGKKLSDITDEDVLSKYPVTGAEFTVYTDEECTQIAKDINGNDIVLKVTTQSESDNGKGYTQKVAVIASDEGITYYVKETQTPLNYDGNNEIIPVVVKTSDTISRPAEFTYKNKVITHDVTVIKVSKDGAIYPLDDIEFTIYTDAECRNIAKDIKGNEAILTVKAVEENEQIIYKTEKFTLPVGMYYIKETKIPENSSYILNDTIFDLDLTEQDRVIVVENELNKIFIKVKKTVTQSDLLDKFPIEGTEFTIYTDSNCNTIAKDIYGNDAILIVSKVIVDNEVIYETNTVELQFGTYWVKETKIPEYYKPTQDIQKIENPVIDGINELVFENELQVGLGKVQKIW